MGTMKPVGTGNNNSSNSAAALGPPIKRNYSTEQRQSPLPNLLRYSDQNEAITIPSKTENDKKSSSTQLNFFTPDGYWIEATHFLH